MIQAITLISPLDILHRDSTSHYLILDARPYAHYIAGHIPGAIWMGWEGWCDKAPDHAGRTLAQAGYWGLLKESPMKSLGELLGQYGVSDDRPILVYADGPRSKGREARIAWMLLYWGLSSVSLLNGGWRVWRQQGGCSDRAIPKPTRGEVHLHEQAHRRVQLHHLRQAMQHRTQPLLIDVRSRVEFVGQKHVYQPRRGRLPGAVHFPFTALFDDAGSFVTQSSYLQSLPPEIKNAPQCVSYCEVGVRSCLFALLHELYTGQVVANFDGSVMQWALEMTLPMEC
ncbi:MAG: sulfurtransferase [Ktedonobacteraceae bacterium]